MNYLTAEEKQKLEYKEKHHHSVTMASKWVNQGYIDEGAEVNKSHLIALTVMSDPTAYYSDSAAPANRQDKINQLINSIYKARPELKGQINELLYKHGENSTTYIPTIKHASFQHRLNDDQFNDAQEYLRLTKELRTEIQNKLVSNSHVVFKIAPTAVGVLWSPNLALSTKQQKVLDDFYLCYRKLWRSVENPDMFFRRLSGHYIAKMTPKKVEHTFLQVGELFIYLN